MPATPAKSSPSEQSTSAPAGSSAATAPNSPNAGFTSTKTLTEIDFSTLSPRSQAIRILIGDRLPEGYKLNEIASELGQSSSWVSQRLDELRNELLLSSGRFFPLTAAEHDALKQSIADDGVQTPILIGRHLPIVDGRNRCLISRELGLSEIPAVFLTDKSADEEHELSVALNAARRHLSQAQKRALIRSELGRDPSRSDRRIAAICGTDHKTVAEQRSQMAEEERLHRAPVEAERPSRYQPAAREDTLGRQRSAPPPRAASEENADRPLGHAHCCHGQRHAILRDGDGYRLEAR